MVRKNFCSICGRWYSECECGLSAFQEAHKKAANELKTLLGIHMGKWASENYCDIHDQPLPCGFCASNNERKHREAVRKVENMAPSFNGRTSDCLSEGEGSIPSGVATTFVVHCAWDGEDEVFCCCDSMKKAEYLADRLNKVFSTSRWYVSERAIL